MKKKKRRYSRLVILDSKNDTTKEIKKILSEKHPGYEKRSKDEKMFNQACFTKFESVLAVDSLR